MLNYPTYHNLETEPDIQRACFEQDQNIEKLQDQIDQLFEEIVQTKWELQHILDTHDIIDPSKITGIYVGQDGKVEKLWPLDCDKLAQQAAQ